MSLNGLDASAVVEAHSAALADPGGWFALKYTNRDTVELLSRGTGGVAEAKTAIEQYEEKSPLYGLLQYRRKRVILKYVPVGTSRLLQVRLTVQFQSVLDAFPHDTIFSCTAPSELSESALGLSAMLQPTAHGTSLSSAASLRNRRLNEISEDVEESSHTRTESNPSTVTMSPPKRNEARIPSHSVKSSMASMDSLPESALRAKALLARRKEADLASEYEHSPPPVPTKNPNRPEPLLPLQPPPFPAFDKSLPATPQATPPPSRHGPSRLRQENLAPPAIPARAPRPSIDSPMSATFLSSHLSPNESHSISQWNDQVAAYAGSTSTYKPKKKLGPRPHVDSTNRPKTSNTTIVNLPQSVRASNRTNINVTGRPGSQQSSRSVPSRFVHHTAGLPPPLPTSTQLPSLFRTPDHRKPPSIASSAVTEGGTATPEKMRLMKALQMRKRNQILTQRALTSQSQRASTLHEEPSMEELQPPARNPNRSPKTPPTNGLVSRITEETKSNGTSATDSPASATTASGTQSTKPSSVSGETDGKNSMKESIIDSTASSTPKALPERREVGTESGTMSRWESSDRSRDGAVTPPGPQTIVQSATPESVKRAKEDRPIVPRPESVSANALGLPPRSSSRRDVISLTRSLKRASILGRLKAPSSADVSVNSDDDAFMDELQNATVHEAKPISVARTPETPKMRKLSVDKIRDMTKAATNGSVASSRADSPEAHRSTSASVRSASTVTPYRPQSSAGEAASMPLSKKSSLGSGITKRIKALEVVTNRGSVHGSVPSTSPTTRDANKSTFSSLMNRASFISQLSANKTSEQKSIDVSSPEPRAGEQRHSNGPFMEAVEEVDEMFSAPRKGETISVTARIVRDPRKGATSAALYTNDHAGNLHRSPLIVEHESQTMEHDARSTNASLSARNLEQYQRAHPPEKSRFSFSSHRSGSTARAQASDGRLSRISAAGKDKRSSKALSETSSVAADDNRSSKASRIMKRVSGLSSRFGNIGSMLTVSKDHLPQETIVEQAEEDRRHSVADSMLQVIDIGDVNVQFPESMLWKRRFMRIDDQGFLIFSPPTDNAHIRTANRKFHLSDLKAPALPDIEREEMSWSVVMEGKDGSTIQCACESRQARAQILQMLLDAHAAYNSLYV